MRLETKVIQVPNDPRRIDSANNGMDVFGWSVQNIQITDRKTIREGDSRGRIDSDGIHVETDVYTEHVNYATITYQRDLDDPTIKQLALLEKKYDEPYHTDSADLAAFNQKDLERKGSIALLVLFVICLFFSSRLLFEILAYVSMVGCPVLFIHSLVAPKFHRAKKHDRENYKQYQANRDEIFSEAYALRNGNQD